ncbi:MAG: thioredoxin domain-containing protein [Gordonia sp. (in: high G+C Gram-positive bacteria)]|uniref:DsbA family protein n=1 Tax=Gordonia sp. (in: high G+C Gram-positive bacteria) TaxID=84139 RepID=UPI0039E5582F
MSKRIWLVLAAIAALVIGLSIVDGRTRHESPTPPTASPAGKTGNTGKTGPLSGLARRTPDDPRALGRVDAPVVMVVFSDFRCPFCGVYERTIQPRLIRKYVTPGKLRIEWRDDPTFGKQSDLAARAGWSAAAQGRFWEFVSAVYRDAPETGHADLTIDVLVARAKAAGVKDLKKFRADTTGDTYAHQVTGDAEPVRRYGITGTPAFVINGEPIIGVQPMDVFESLINDAGGR